MLASHLQTADPVMYDIIEKVISPVKQLSVA